MSYVIEANHILHLFLGMLQKRETKEFLLLANQWGNISKELEKQIQLIAEKEVKTEDQLYRLALYQKFLEDSKIQIQAYSNIASGVISNEQKIYGKAGIESIQKMIELKVKFFQHLPTDTINNFIGKSFYDGAKLNETLFASSYPDYLAKTKDILLQGVALGRNPYQTARLITKECDAPLWQSLRLARTEQMSIYRETSEIQMKESGVVDAMERSEQDDACPECQAANGQIYQFGEEFDTHPNCRGTFIPWFK